MTTQDVAYTHTSVWCNALLQTVRVYVLFSAIRKQDVLATVFEVLLNL
jgi:hypothetical protein